MRLKKVKNADLFVNLSNYVVKNPELFKGKWSDVFGNSNPIDIEIGCGKGQFIMQMAMKYPDRNFIGIEMQDSVLVRAVQKLEKFEEPLLNLKLLSVNADNIQDIFDKEISKIYLNFSDPWPKKRHSKRRLTSKNFLEKYDLIFENEKYIIQKTDNQDFFNFSIEALKDYGYTLKNVIQNLPSNDSVQTEYEEKFRKNGMPIYYLEAIYN